MLNPLPSVPALLDKSLSEIVTAPNAGAFDPSIRIPAGMIPLVLEVLAVMELLLMATEPYPAVAFIAFKRTP